VDELASKIRMASMLS